MRDRDSPAPRPHHALPEFQPLLFTVQSPRGRRCQVRSPWTLRHTGSGPSPGQAPSPSLLSSVSTTCSTSGSSPSFTLGPGLPGRLESQPSKPVAGNRGREAGGTGVSGIKQTLVQTEWGADGKMWGDLERVEGRLPAMSRPKHLLRKDGTQLHFSPTLPANLRSNPNSCLDLLSASA